jgi:hypothetical protein
MPKIISDLRKTLETAFSVGGKGGGARAFEFYNGFLGRLLWNPTANRDITVPDAAGTIVLQNNGRIDGLSPAITNGQPLTYEQLPISGAPQLSDWNGTYEIGGTFPLTDNVTIILPDIIAGDVNRSIILKRTDRTAFTVTVQAPPGQTVTLTGPTDLNAYGGLMTIRVTSLTTSEQVATTATTGFTITPVTLDFGATPVYSKVFTISHSGAQVSQNVIMVPSAKMPAGVALDELEMDALTVAAYVSAADTVTALVTAIPGPVSGQRAFNYQVL